MPGTDYNFDKLDFEVREYNAGLAERLGSIFSLSGLFGLLSLLCLVGAIIAAAVLIYKKVQENKSAQGVHGGVEKAYGSDVQMSNKDVRDKQKH